MEKRQLEKDEDRKRERERERESERGEEKSESNDILFPHRQDSFRTCYLVDR